MSRKIQIFFFLLIPIVCIGQIPMKFYESHFIKKDKIVFRLFPDNMKIFYELLNAPLKITRTDLDGNNKVVIKDTVRPRWQGDTVTWMKFMRKDINTAGFILQAIYKNIPDPKLSPQKREQQQKLLYDLMLLSCNFDADVAKICGLLFVDSTVTNKRKYVYKIESYKTVTTFTEILSVTIDPSVLSVNPAISDLSCKTKNKIATLKWNFIQNQNSYTGYNVERSEDSLHFTKVNKAPVILMATQFEKNKQFVFYTDTMPAIKRKYYYRIKGINYFGEESDPSNVIGSFSSPPINSNALIDTIVVMQNRAVKLKWRMENNKETKDISSFILFRARKDKGPYVKIYSSSEVNEYIDKFPLATNFYKVCAVTYDHDTLYSYSRNAIIIDAIPPEVPLNFNARVDKKGIVTLTWAKNKEADVQGYKLYKANTLKEEFVQLNNVFIKDTFYTQKLNLRTLSKHIYYSLAASDENFNSSNKTIPIEVKRPDTIAPATPLLLSLKSNAYGVEVRFIQSKSEDVRKHLITRKKGNADFSNVKIFMSPDTVNSFIDTTAELEAQYCYKVIAYDEDENFSASKELTVKHETGFRKKLSDIKYTVDRTEKNISLQWNYNEKEIEKFILYRGKSNEPLTIIKTVDGQTLSYKDKTPNIGNVYEYRIKAVFVNGAESIISDPIKITY